MQLDMGRIIIRAGLMQNSMARTCHTAEGTLPMGNSCPISPKPWVSFYAQLSWGFCACWLDCFFALPHFLSVLESLEGTVLTYSPPAAAAPAAVPSLQMQSHAGQCWAWPALPRLRALPKPLFSKLMDPAHIHSSLGQQGTQTLLGGHRGAVTSKLSCSH